MAESEQRFDAKDVVGSRDLSARKIAAKRGFRDYPLTQLTLVRIREFIREPEAVFWVFVFPMLMAVALGIAFRNTAPDLVQVGITGSNASALSSQLSSSKELKAVVLSPAEANEALRLGKVALIVDANDSGGNLEYRFDPTRPESRTAKLTVDEAIQRAAGRVDPHKTTDQHVTAVGSRYIDFLIPGLIGMNLMGSGIWGIGFSIVNARIRKLLKRFAATPMRRSEYLMSFMLSRLLFLTLEVISMVIFGWLVFNVRIQGNLRDVGIASLIGALSFSGLGLLIAARPKTIEGVSGLMNLAMLPMWLLSGTFFSADRFPQMAQPIIRALPLTALNDALRGIMLEGRPLTAVWLQLVILTLWGGICFIVALRLFRWQ